MKKNVKRTCCKSEALCRGKAEYYAEIYWVQKLIYWKLKIHRKITENTNIITDIR